MNNDILNIADMKLESKIGSGEFSNHRIILQLEASMAQVITVPVRRLFKILKKIF
ncbi:MAG: hypothetical protein LBL77_01545 [Endomicrobium sp.]|jgi:thiazole synthase ThiGH ThiG subunit|nr:hypothetical protein [Endomicrobium sp.]